MKHPVLIVEEESGRLIASLSLTPAEEFIWSKDASSVERSLGSSVLRLERSVISEIESARRKGKR